MGAQTECANHIHPLFCHLPREVAGGCFALGSLLEPSSTDSSSALQVAGTQPESPQAADLHHLNKQVTPAASPHNTWEEAVTNPPVTQVCALGPPSAAVGKDQ